MQPTRLVLHCLTVTLLLAACGPTPADMAATATQAAAAQAATQTAAAPTATQTPLPSPTVTLTHTPTATASPTPSHTPTRTPRPSATPRPTETPSPVPTATSTRVAPTQPPAPPAAACALVGITPVPGATDPFSGASVPSFNFQAVGFTPGETVMANLTDAATRNATSNLMRADAGGAVAGSLTWSLFGFGAVPTDVILSVNGVTSDCTASQALRWP